MHCPGVEHNDSTLWDQLAAVQEVVASHVWRSEPERVVTALDLRRKSEHSVKCGLAQD